MGLAVGAACIALSVLLPGIGTVAVGALFGAGMGAICQTVYIASSGKLGLNDLDVAEALIDDLEYAISLFN